MPSTERHRIDYQPGEAAREALSIAGSIKPDFRQQELIDWLLIVGISVLTHEHWVMPPLRGRSRDEWALPPQVRCRTKNPGHR